MSDINVKPILKQFLLSITGNDIMQTNNDNYDCINKFTESERYQKALQQANDLKTVCIKCGSTGFIVQDGVWSCLDCGALNFD